MAQVELQFSVCDDIGSWAIRLYDHGPWSHVDAVLPDGLLGARLDELGGKPAGVQLRPFTYCNFHAISRVFVDCTEDQRAKFYEFLNSQIGKPYDPSAIAGFVFDRDWRNPDSWFCSELQGVALEDAGIFPHKLALPTNKLTPSGLYLALSVIVDVAAPNTINLSKSYP